MQVFPRHAATAFATRPTTGAASLKTRSRFRVVCASCQWQQRRRQQRVSFSSLPALPQQAQTEMDQHSSPPPSPPPPPPRSGYARLTSRRLISLGGVDAPRFLQGIITSSIPSIRERGGFYSGFLNATGRVLHDVFVYVDTLGVGVAAEDRTLDSSQAFLIEVDANQVGELTRHLRRYMLRSKLKVRALGDGEGEGGVGVWHVWEDSNSNRASGSSSGSGSGSGVLSSLLPPGGHHQKDTVILRDDRAPGHGYRILSTQRSGGLPPPAVVDSLGQATDASYQVRRYLLGVPEGQAEIPRGSALPLESNMDLMGGVDFRKGCYVGQELTIRTKHRGVVRKRVLPCMLYGTDETAPRQLEYVPNAFQSVETAAEVIPADLSIGRDGKRGRSVGNWLRGVGNVGFALCRLQVMTDVQLPGETATAPFDPSNEFVMRWGGDEESGEGGKAVKVKAFVPEWLRTRLDESNNHGS